MLSSKSTFYLFCKSYYGDLGRLKNLVISIDKHNRDQIPLYICVPSKDLSVFQENLSFFSGKINWITDESIVLSNPRGSLDRYYSWDGRLSQQVIKSDFWRLFNFDITYLCIDSESLFIKDFYLSDFMVDKKFPYTVIHQNKELLQLAANKKIQKVIDNFRVDCSAIKKIFGRLGVDYEFGPTPVIWSSLVWRDLDLNYFQVNDIDIWMAIELIPSELRWYGEAVLKYKSIPLFPMEPIFRVYHYDWQYYTYKRLGDKLESIQVSYLGLLKQSNWDYLSDYGDHAHRKKIMSKIIRALKSFFSRFR